MAIDILYDRSNLPLLRKTFKTKKVRKSKLILKKGSDFCMHYEGKPILL